MKIFKRIIKRVNSSIPWKQIVQCEGQEPVFTFCGSTLELELSDLRKMPHPQYFKPNNFDYWYECPVCKIPKHLQEHEKPILPQEQLNTIKTISSQSWEDLVESFEETK